MKKAERGDKNLEVTQRARTWEVGDGPGGWIRLGQGGTLTSGGDIGVSTSPEVGTSSTGREGLGCVLMKHKMRPLGD